MTSEEYAVEYQRLSDVFPNKFLSAAKTETVWKYVKEFDISWFRSLVDRIVMTTHGDVDIGEVVAAERRARKSKQFADDVVKAMDNVSSRITDAGFEKVLKSYGANSLLEAITKSRKGEL